MRLALVLLLFALAACGRTAPGTSGSPSEPSNPPPRSDPTADVPTDPPSITGTITALGPGRSLRIEANPHSESGAAKAQVTLLEKAQVLDRSGAVLGFGDLRRGAVVSVWFSGPVGESYPVQARARVVVVEPPPPASWTVSFTGLGPVRAGMTVPEAQQALGVNLVSRGGETGSCSYVFVDGKTEVAMMVIDGSIARVDIQQGPIRTTDGAGIGDTEERIRSLYGAHLEVQSHKYIDGHYLIVRPGPAAAVPDSNYRIIFETDGRRVLRFRSGRMPEVRWIEGCS